jgi:hypothetical protein
MDQNWLTELDFWHGPKNKTIGYFKKNFYNTKFHFIKIIWNIRINEYKIKLRSLKNVTEVNSIIDKDRWYHSLTFKKKQAVS